MSASLRDAIAEKLRLYLFHTFDPQAIVSHGVMPLVEQHITLEVQAAYERAAQHLESQEIVIIDAQGVQHEKACKRMVQETVEQAAKSIRALGSASALELALAEARREEAESILRETDKLGREIFMPRQDWQDELTAFVRARIAALSVEK